MRFVFLLILLLIQTAALAGERCTANFDVLFRGLLGRHSPQKPLVISQGDPAILDLRQSCSIVNSLHIAQTAVAAAGRPPITDLAVHVRTLHGYWNARNGQTGLRPSQHAETTDAIVKRFIPGVTTSSNVTTLPMGRAAEPGVSETTRLGMADFLSPATPPNQLISKTLSIAGFDGQMKCRQQHSVLIVGSGIEGAVPFIEISDPSFPDRTFRLGLQPVELPFNGKKVNTIQFYYLDEANPYASTPAQIRMVIATAVTTTTINLPPR